jgi:feruloyl esterase
MRLIGLAATVSLVALAGCTKVSDSDAAAPATLLAGAAECAAVTPAMLGATSASGKWVPTDPAAGLPGFCEVTATLAPVAGSTIGVIYRLPASWNGKLLGSGGGGWIGNTGLQAAAEGLRKGYATAQTDAGHPIGDVWDNSWTANPVAAADFSYRGIHEMTVAGKKLVAAYYGAPHRLAYYQGCSTGGRMGLMEAQRYPDDYDAMSVGAPVYTLQVQTSAVLRNNLFHQDGAGFTAEDLSLANKSALAACDADDGLKDGLINNPRQCSWDPKTIECSGAKNATCLAPAQVTALRAAYDGVKDPDGEWAMLPMSRGGELGWGAFIATDGSGVDPSGGGGLRGLLPLIFGETQPDLATFTLANVQTVRGSPFAQMYEAKNPDLAKFFGNGGKLLVWHGESDQGPSPVGTEDYVRAVQAKSPAAADSLRYFALPGVGHCRGGNGADQTELLDALDRWAETGTAPETLLGTRADGTVSRPLCAWPKVAHYKGKGNPNQPANWECKSPAS